MHVILIEKWKLCAITKYEILQRLEFHRVNKNQKRETSKPPVVGIHILCWSYWKSKCADKILDVYNALTCWSGNNNTAFITAFDNEIEINWDDQRPCLTIVASMKGQQQEYDGLTLRLIHLVIVWGLFVIESREACSWSAPKSGYHASLEHLNRLKDHRRVEN